MNADINVQVEPLVAVRQVRVLHHATSIDRLWLGNRHRHAQRLETVERGMGHRSGRAHPVGSWGRAVCDGIERSGDIATLGRRRGLLQRS